jgi:hypothetical protein
MTAATAYRRDHDPADNLALTAVLTFVSRANDHRMIDRTPPLP